MDFIDIQLDYTSVNLLKVFIFTFIQFFGLYIHYPCEGICVLRCVADGI